MQTFTLNHFSIRPHEMERTVAFYTEALGLVVGPRPDKGFPGFWLYCGDNPILRLVGARPGEPTPAFDAPDKRRTGYLDHMAFSVTDPDAMKARLSKAAVPFREKTDPDRGEHQVFVTDPNGIELELVFPLGETATQP